MVEVTDGRIRHGGGYRRWAAAARRDGRGRSAAVRAARGGAADAEPGDRGRGGGLSRGACRSGRRARDAGAWCATATHRGERSRPGSARSRSGGRGCATVAPATPRASASPRRCLPAYLRRTRNVEELLPWLYLKGISTGPVRGGADGAAGPGRAGPVGGDDPSPGERVAGGARRWQGRDLSARRYVYVWADGVYFTPRLEHERQCILVLIGADASGKKELWRSRTAFARASRAGTSCCCGCATRTASTVDPELATGDGALGFWKAARKVWPTTRQQRAGCTRPPTCSTTCRSRCRRRPRPTSTRSTRPRSRPDAEAAFDRFLAKYRPEYDKAALCLAKDREALLAFYDVPAEHWKHVRSTNPVESTFATVRPEDRQDQGLPVT